MQLLRAVLGILEVLPTCHWCARCMPFCTHAHTHTHTHAHTQIHSACTQISTCPAAGGRCFCVSLCHKPLFCPAAGDRCSRAVLMPLSFPAAGGKSGCNLGSLPHRCVCMHACALACIQSMQHSKNVYGVSMSRVKKYRIQGTYVQGLKVLSSMPEVMKASQVGCVLCLSTTSFSVRPSRRTHANSASRASENAGADSCNTAQSAMSSNKSLLGVLEELSLPP